MIVIVTQTIKNPQDVLIDVRDTLIYSSFEELKEATEKMVMNISVLITTSDVFIRDPKGNAKLYFDILEDKFIKIDEKIHLVNTKESPEVSFLLFKDKTINVKEMNVNQDNIMALAQGRLAYEDAKIQPFVVHRYDKHSYLAAKELEERKKNRAKVIDSSDLIEGIDMSIFDNDAFDMPISYKETTRTKVSTLLYSRNTKYNAVQFMIVYSQILSKYGKTILVETDPQYLVLKHYMNQVNIPYSIYYIDNLLKDTTKTVQEIVDDSNNLIIISYKNRESINEEFIITSIYNILDGKVGYMLCALPLGSMYIGKPTIIVPVDVPQILEDTAEYPISIENFKLIAVANTQVREIVLDNSDTLSSALSELLEEDIVCDLFEISSLQEEGGLLDDLYLFK